MMRWRRNLIRVFTLAKDALFISTYYRALVISKAHKHILQRSKILHIADDKYQRRKNKKGRV
jgi:hypothetical protein